MKQPRFLALALGLALALSATVSEAVPILPNLEGGLATVNVGDTFMIDVSITDAVDLTNYQFDLGFDALILQANSVTEGSFFATGDPTLFVVAFIDTGIGLIGGVSNSLSPFAFPAVSGGGQLAVIEFTALASGTSPLTLSNTFLNLSDLGFTVTNGSVCVNGGSNCGGAVPEPSSLVLMGLGGVVVWGIKRWSRLGAAAF